MKKLMWRRFRKTHIGLHHEREGAPLRVVADAVIAHPLVGEGRLLAVVILDTTARPDVTEYIRVHAHMPPGDVICQWGQLAGHENAIALIVSVVRPIAMVMIIEFDLMRGHGVLIEQILATRALYIQAGRDGDRVIKNPNAAKVIIEVPELGFSSHWNEIHLRHLTGQMRQRGLNRHNAKAAAKKKIQGMRRFGSVRAPASKPTAN